MVFSEYYNVSWFQGIGAQERLKFTFDFRDIIDRAKRWLWNSIRFAVQATNQVRRKL